MAQQWEPGLLQSIQPSSHSAERRCRDRPPQAPALGRAHIAVHGNTQAHKTKSNKNESLTNKDNTGQTCYLYYLESGCMLAAGKGASKK